MGRPKGSVNLGRGPDLDLRTSAYLRNSDNGAFGWPAKSCDHPLFNFRQDLVGAVWCEVCVAERPVVSTTIIQVPQCLACGESGETVGVRCERCGSSLTYLDWPEAWDRKL